MVSHARIAKRRRAPAPRVSMELTVLGGSGEHRGVLARAPGVWAPAVAPRTGLGKVAAVTMGLAFASLIPVA